MKKTGGDEASYAFGPAARFRAATPYIVFLLVAGAAVAGLGASRTLAGRGQVVLDSPLPRILERTREYCRDLASASLNVVCMECVETQEYLPPIRLFSMGPAARCTVKSESFDYDYQPVGSGESVRETRALVRENGRACHETNSAVKSRIFKYQNLIFGPVGLLSEYWQTRLAYSYIGEDRAEGCKAFVIEAASSGPPEPNHPYGKVWVSQDDFSVLKIDWDEKSLGNYDMIERTARSIGRDMVPAILATAEFGVVKNGIRFPSRVTILEDYKNFSGTVRVSKTTIAYKNYRFFTVETEVRY